MFRYVRLQDVDTFCSYGWMAVADLGIPHNAWSILMWHCECEEYNPNKDRSLASDESVVDFLPSTYTSGADHAASD